MVQTQALTRRPLAAKPATTTQKKKKHTTSSKGSLLYVKKLHKSNGRFRSCWGPARRGISAFFESHMREVVDSLRTDAPRQTITLGDVFAAIRSCSSSSLAEQLIADIQSSPDYGQIHLLSQRQKKKKAEAEQ